MIPLIREEMVRRGWLTDDELPNIIALAQGAPGVMAVNMAIFTGYRLRGTRGSVAAAIGTILPSFAAILLIASLFAGYGSNPTVERIFRGIRPVVVALILVPMVNMARRSCKSVVSWLIAIGSLVAVGLAKVSPILILALVAAGAWAAVSSRKGPE